MNILRAAKGNIFFNNSFYIFIIRFFPSLASLLVLIYYSRSLTREAYGAYQSFWIQINMLYPVAAFGIHAFIVTYKSSFTAKLIRSINASQYALYGLWVLLFAGLFAWLQASSNALPFIIPLLFLVYFTITTIIESFLMVCRSFGHLALVNVLYASGFTIIHWLLLQNDFSLQKLFLYLLFLSTGKLLYYVWLAVKMLRRYTIDDSNVATQNVRSLWLHMGVYDIVQVSFNWIDKFIISFLLTASVSAVYFNGAMNIPFLPLLLSASISSTLMQLADRAHQETSHTVWLVNHASRLLSCIVFPLFVFLVLYRDQLFSVLFAGKYNASVPIFLMSVMVVPLRAYGFTAVLQSNHKGAIINLGAILDLILACTLMYPLYLVMGLPGVALSFVISTYLQSTFYLYHTARILKVNVLQLIPLGNWMLKLLIYSVLLVLTHYVGRQYASDVFSVVLGSSIMVIVMLVSLGIQLKAEKQKHGIRT